MREFVAAAVLVSAIGCADEETLWLAKDDFQTVVAVLSSPRGGRLQIFDASTDAALELELHADETFFLLRYAADPNELELPVGEFATPLTGRRPPSPDEILIFDDSSFVSVSPQEVELDSLRLPWRNDDPCLSIELETELELPNTFFTRTLFLFRWAADRALVVIPGGTFFELGAAPGYEAIEVDPELPTNGAFWDSARDELWLVNGDGRVARGHPRRGFQALASRTATIPDHRIYIDGPRDDSAFELFLATRHGRFERFDGETWNLIEDTMQVDAEGVLWTGVEEGVAIDLSRNTTTRYERGVRTTDIVPVVTGDQLKSVHWVPGYGPMIGTLSGDVFQWTGEFWTKRTENPGGLRVLLIMPRLQGFMYGGQTGRFLQYVEEHGFCEGGVWTDFDFVSAVRFGDRLVGCGGIALESNVRCGWFSVR